MSMIRKYFQKVDEHTKTYGEKTIVLWECGSFFEVYGIRDGKTKNIITPQIQEFAKICDFRIANKKVGIGANKIVMAGFGTHLLDKYLKKLDAHGYTVPIYTQDVACSNTTRSLSYISSPGTFFSEDTITNNSMCCWIEKYDKSVIRSPYIICGMASINIFDAIPYLFSFRREKLHLPTTFDEIERFYAIHQPSEVIIIYKDFSKEEINDIIQFASIQCPIIHTFSLDDDDSPLATEAKNCEKQTFQEEIINTYYNVNDYDTFIASLQLDKYPLATSAFCFLLEFLRQHNHNLVQKIHEPRIENIQNRLILANHSLQQLNILDTRQHKGKLSSIASFLNRCKTAIGRRRLHNIIVHPITDTTSLEKQYKITEHLLKTNYIEELRPLLRDIKDVEKLFRKSILKRITPADFISIYSAACISLDIFKKIEEDTVLMDYLERNNSGSPLKDITSLKKLFKKTFNINIAATTHETNINCFKRGYSKEIDNCEKKYLDACDELNVIQNLLHNVIAKKESRAKVKPTVKINITEKSFYSLVTTNRRATILKAGFSAPLTDTYTSSFSREKKEYVFQGKNLTTFAAGKSNHRITSTEIDAVTRTISTALGSFKEIIQTEFTEFIDIFKSYGEKMQALVDFIGTLDVALSKAHIAKKFNYCRPIIKQASKSFFRAENMRHCLIEHLQTKEIYVPNNVSLGEKNNGILLFGTNAVGKSSLIRSIGITIVLAQSGHFVPCSSLEFFPYTRLFTRILGNDNIFKGLSTFAVEMSELRTILNMTDENSLVLGDELCSGTEIHSAIKIFTAGVVMLHQKQSNFMFATHLHSITNLPEIKKLDRLSLKHMTVIYDREKDCLIYERKLQDGQGEKVYGIEVCKSLHLPQDFMNLVYQIQNPLDSILSGKKSRYNAAKIRGMCQICNKEKAVDIHHLQHQKNANKNNFIEHFYKNHKANLLSVCKKCHDKFTREDIEHTIVKTSKGMKLQEKIF